MAIWAANVFGNVVGDAISGAFGLELTAGFTPRDTDV
jgi:hypothetical protein